MKRGLIFFALAVVVLASAYLVSAQEVSYCCERLESGAWCQNAPQDSCDTNYRSTPTSCESTSYCQLGWCYDSTEGTCSGNTPQKVCEQEGGSWEADDGSGEPPAQCSLGCCLLNDQAAFVTQVRCEHLSSFYGLETNFRGDISSELSCIASAEPDATGACVYEENFQRSCTFITKRECNSLGASQGANSTIEFHEDTLCTDESLGTVCAPTEQTTCVEGRDEVYFVDSCGNVANIYDANKAEDKQYWSDVVSVAESCNPDASNADSATCGTCNYFLGSTCKAYERGEDAGRPQMGDYICRDLSCEYEGESYSHGETWCADSSGIDEVLPGSRHFRLLCYNGDVTVEPCADFRQEICIESSVNDFSVAACRANQWQDCFAQDNELDCSNEDRRDCIWVPGIEINEARQGSVSGGSNDLSTEQPFSSGNVGGENTFNGGITGNFIEEGTASSDLRAAESEPGEGACLPKDQPGFNFWEGNDGQSLCALASKECVVKFEKKTFGDWECAENCECLEDDWELEQNRICKAVGDCGNSVNFINMQGYNTGYKITSADVED